MTLSSIDEFETHYRNNMELGNPFGRRALRTVVKFVFEWETDTLHLLGLDKKCNAKVTIVDELQEWNYGDYEGLRSLY